MTPSCSTTATAATAATEANQANGSTCSDGDCDVWRRSGAEVVWQRHICRLRSFVCTKAAHPNGHPGAERQCQHLQEYVSRRVELSAEANILKTIAKRRCCGSWASRQNPHALR